MTLENEMFDAARDVLSGSGKVDADLKKQILAVAAALEDPVRKTTDPKGCRDLAKILRKFVE